jgi:hypothetical protein
VDCLIIGFPPTISLPPTADTIYSPLPIEAERATEDPQSSDDSAICAGNFAPPLLDANGNDVVDENGVVMKDPSYSPDIACRANAPN